MKDERPCHALGINMDRVEDIGRQWKSRWRRISACMLAADMERDVSIRACEEAELDLTLDLQSIQSCSGMLEGATPVSKVRGKDDGVISITNSS